MIRANQLVRPRLALAATLVSALLVGAAISARAQAVPPTASSTITLKLWADPKTGQVFTKPGKGRVQMMVPAEVTGGTIPPAATAKIEQRIEQKTQAQIDASVAKVKADDGVSNAALVAQVQRMEPAWQEYSDRWLKKFKLGTLVYGDYSLYTHTSFGPQFLTQINPPGPGNNIYNSFDISRAYLNFTFSPTDAFTFRVTPNIYRTQGVGTPTNEGRVTAINSNLTGDLGYRLKYAYLDWNTPFASTDHFKENKVTFGQQPNPLVDWEENLYGFRYTSLTPWNYESLSSTQTGLALKGPIKFHETQYVDYDFGAYNNATFSQNEQTNTKQAMARVTINPLGARSRYDSLGITTFFDYGYANNPADVTTGGFKRSYRLSRFSEILHYTADTWGLAGEFEYGKGAFISNNLFSGSGPADSFSGASNAPTQYAANSQLVNALQNTGGSRQFGWDFFGHVQIPRTPITLFGQFNWLMPNSQVQVNPFDFQRWVFGAEYKVNKYLRFALDSQNLDYYHSQFIFPNSEVAQFDPAAAAKLKTLTTGVNANGDVLNPVFRPIHAIFLNMEFSY